MSASDSGSGQTRRGRGVTRLADVTSRRVDGHRRHVDIDPRSDQVSFFPRSYLGKLAKSHVSILHACWDDVPKVDKNLLWQDIQGKRLAAQERQRLNDAPHLLSRGGYAKLEKKLRKSRADALGLESSDLAPAPARYELWKAARIKSDGNMTSSSAALISQRIKQPIHYTVIHEDDDMAEAEDDPLSKLMTRLPRLKKAPLELYWDLRVFGLTPNVPVYITLSDALECNQQLDSWECGFYVMCWIKTIIRAVITDDWNERFKITSPILEDRIRQIRQKWTAYLLQRWS
ncbi:hypothetical protein LR48_Vigan03g165200 [Vigna angularis]|uniref:Ubiquitin-like protease family profile domain-containing protein n=1 Tax=Phaseolus angularis TaxID=3914 RepID=A0A0L9U656_PHAAN|nr:hypothetical protein LR48_Vigan03g165200 [Vigna angularis]